MGAPNPGNTPSIYTPQPTASHAVSRTNETSAAALGARARADIEARTIVALNRPRDLTDFRRRLIEACQRKEFAVLARYAKPIGGGKKATGFTIRFAEECVRHYRNVDISTTVVSEDDERRVVRCAVTDLESNVPWSSEVVVPKTVERRKVQDGDEVLGQRINSEGALVYIKRATEDEIANNQNRLCAKVVRNLVLNHIPSDILEDAEDVIFQTSQKEETADPVTVRKQVADLFYRLGVTSDQLADYLEHPVETMTPAELHVMRQIYNGMKSEGTTWAEVMEMKRGTSATPDAPKPQRKRNADPIDAAIEKVESTSATLSATPSPEPSAPAADVSVATGGTPPMPTMIPKRITDMAAMIESGKRLAPDAADDLRQFITDATLDQVHGLAHNFPKLVGPFIPAPSTGTAP